MRFNFDTLRATRNNILKDIEGLSLEQINAIPEGFNNNIVWNFVHLIATQQRLVYLLSGTPYVAPEDIVEGYKIGTKPEQPVTQLQLEEYKQLLLTTVDQMEQDYEQGVFGSDFKTYTTSYKVTLTTVEDAINFNNVHEGLHYGVIMTLIHAV